MLLTRKEYILKEDVGMGFSKDSYLPPPSLLRKLSLFIPPTKGFTVTVYCVKFPLT